MCSPATCRPCVRAARRTVPGAAGHVVRTFPVWPRIGGGGRSRRESGRWRSFPLEDRRASGGVMVKVTGHSTEIERDQPSQNHRATTSATAAASAS
jgi:hypothetical protein